MVPETVNCNNNLIFQIDTINKGLKELQKTLNSPLDLKIKKTSLDILEQNYKIYASLIKQGNEAYEKSLKCTPPDRSYFKIQSLVLDYLAITKVLQPQFEKFWAQELPNFIPRIEILFKKSIEVISNNITILASSYKSLVSSYVITNFKKIDVQLKCLDLVVDNYIKRLTLACKVISNPKRKIYHTTSTNDLKSLFNFTLELNEALIDCRFKCRDVKKSSFILPYDQDFEKPGDFEGKFRILLKDTEALLSFCQKNPNKSQNLLSFHMLKNNLKTLDTIFLENGDSSKEQYSEDIDKQYSKYEKINESFQNLEDFESLDKMPCVIDFNTPFITGSVHIESGEDLIKMMEGYNHCDDTLRGVHSKVCKLSTIIKYIELENFEPYFVNDPIV